MEEKQMELLTTTMRMPDDIMMNILSRLPSKSLKRFKCGCKYLFNLVEDPTFVKMHLLHHSTLAINNPSLLISNPQGTLCSFNCRDVVHKSSSSSSVCHRTVQTDHSNLPFKYPHEGFDIVGHCNGLICLAERVVGDDDYVIFLWNPSSSESKRLPHDSCYRYPIGVIFDLKLIIDGFYYDHTIDDYKVIKLVHYSEDVSLLEVSVYTLRTNSWTKKIKTSPIVDCHYDTQCWSGLYVHGALHWLMMKSQSQYLAKIISFHIVNEEYLEIQILDSMVDDCGFDVVSFYDVSLTVQVLNGCICIFYTSPDHKFLKVWMMKEYNVKGSWTKLYHIDMQLLSIKRGLRRRGKAMPSNLLPVMYCKDGGILVVWRGIYLISYDPKKNKARRVYNIKNHVKNGFVEETYIESLVSLKDQTDGSKKKKPRRRRRRTSILVFVSIFSFFLILLLIFFCFAKSKLQNALLY